MSRMTAYTHGQFSWVDLHTPDAATAQRFYTDLFGWQSKDQSTDQGGVYTLFQQGGLDICGMGEMSDAMVQSGIPAVWNNYVSVDDADAVAARVVELGGSIEMPVMQVMAAGRMAMFVDTTGARFAVWEVGEHIGAGLVNEPNTLGWNELGTREPAAAMAFYGDLFGWTFDSAGDGYHEIKLGERANGGIRTVGPDEPEGPPRWVPYFSVTDCDASVARLQELGGQALMAPVDIEPGRFCVVLDRQGALMTLMRIHHPE